MENILGKNPPQKKFFWITSKKNKCLDNCEGQGWIK